MSPAPADRPDPSVPPTHAASTSSPLPGPSPAPPDARPDAPLDPALPDAAPDAAPHKGIGQGRGKRGPRLFRHFKVDEVLAAEDRIPYETLLLDPRQTVDSLTAWLHARGYSTVSRAAVHRHRRHFEQDVQEIRKSAKIAGQFAAIARAQGGAGSLADASQFRLEQMFLERLFGMKGDDRLSGKEWTEFGKAMSSLLDNRKRYETLRLEWEEKAKRVAAELEKPDGKRRAEPEVVARVREILGV